MRICPTCGKAGIRDHSVLVAFEVLSTYDPAAGEALVGYSRCARCDAVFRRPLPETLVPASADALGERPLWILPPWKPRTEEASFEMSWDVAEAFFEDLAPKLEYVVPLGGLVAELRAGGFDQRLRAGQSLSSFGLSRSRDHGLRPDQSHLYLSPRGDGWVVVRGLVGGQAVDLGPVPPRLEGTLLDAITALAAVEID